MAENQTVTEDSRQQRGSSIPKGQSASSGTGSMASTAPSKPHTLKAGIGHSPKAATMISPEGKHHHYHHHHHHHSHSHHNNPHVIHRTTSESLRLGTEVNAGAVSTGASSPTTTSSSSGTSNCNSAPQLHLSAPGPRKPKTSSFQITSVTVGNKLSADNGEDSADDLDESHTDDNSRITDLENETPSVSEDTFSKEDVFFSSNALGTAPVIPTSSQYGLVIVDPDLGGVGGTAGQTLSNVHVSVTDAGINIVGPAGTKLNDADQKDLQHRNERFKVVKIESTEPFKRGRWMCMDYLDHTTLQQTQANAEGGSAPTTGTSGTITTNDSGANVSENHIDAGSDVPEAGLQTNFHTAPVSPGQTLQNAIQVPVSEPSANPQPTTNTTGSIPATIQAQTLSHVPNAPSTNVQQQNVTAQSLPPAQIQQAISGQPPTQPAPNQATSEFQNASNPGIQGQSQPAQFYLNNQQPQAAPPAHVHGATLPSNINMQNGVPTNLPSHTQQPQQQPPQPQPQPQPPQTLTSASAPMAVPPSTLASEQTSTSATSSCPPSMVQQPSIQPTGNVIQQGQNMTAHSAPQTQVSSEMFVPQPVPQSYTTPPVSIATISTASTISVAPQDVQVDSPSSMPSAPQTNVVISPAGGGTASILPAPEGAAQQQSSHQPSPAQGITPVVQDTAAPSTVSTISDPSAIAAAIQAQQQVPAAPTTLQTQQSVVASDETPQQPLPALETDNESVSSLALALSSNKKSAPNKLHTPATSQPSTSSTAMFSLEQQKSAQKEKETGQLQQNIYTNLALGNSIQKLMGASIGKSDDTDTSGASTPREPSGIPIPKSPRTDNDAVMAFSASPSTGGFRTSPFFSGSPEPNQVASSYDTYANINIHNVGGLRGIGKTNSIPVGCFAYRTPGGIEIGRGSANSATRRGGCSANDNSASGTSAVAIDNKIEQAMDLVKSHLMIAVREEVEVLKEKISELMERINQLELENTILKANVSQETLSQLSATMQTAAAKPPQNTNTSNGPVS